MEKRTRGRPKTLKRGEVLDIIMRSYWGEGVKNVSINEICRRTGTSKPGLYREFGNEDALIKAALENYEQVVLRPMSLALNEDVTPEMAVQGLFNLYKKDRQRPKGCLFVRMLEVRDTLGPETNKLIRKLKKNSLKSYQDWAEKLKVKGIVSPEVSAEFAGQYIDSQFNNAFAMIARGEKLEVVMNILSESFKAICR